MKKVVVGVVAVLTLAGCSPRQSDNALTGAAVGGATGAVIGGAATGRAGGALAGAAVGAAAGAAVGAASTPPGPRCYYDPAYGRVCER
jgi:osmotically inducible lipoprotein OsmB